MSLRILTFIDSFSFDRLGGARRVFLETSRCLVSKGCKIDVICRNDGDLDADSRNLDIKFHAYKQIRGNFMTKYLQYSKNIRSIFFKYQKNHKPDLIIYHSSSAVFGMEKILKSLSMPKIYIYHSPWAEEYKIPGSISPFNIFKSIPSSIFSAARNSIESKYLMTASGIVVLSSYMEKLMREIHPETAGIPAMVIPGAADINKFHPAGSRDEMQSLRKKHSLPADSFLVLTVRGLVPRTGVDTLIGAFSSIHDRFPSNVNLVIVGTGSMDDKLKQQCRALGIDRKVIFTGYVPEDAISDYYRACDLFVLPTKHLEGFGLSTVEALACGLPVIGTDIGGTVEILNKISPDLLIKGCSEEAIAEKLLKYSNTESLAGLGSKSLKCVLENYTWDKHAESLLDFYDFISSPG